jgi:signal transduction histidine kinase
MYRELRALTVNLSCKASAQETIYVDLRKLLRAGAALVQNAVKFTPDGGRVEVEVGFAGADLICRVADTGVGIAEAEREKIFDLFYEAADVKYHRTSGHEFGGGGLGIGLPLALAIARLHGGGIVYDPRPGGGSVFTLRVPRAPQPSIPQ